MRANIIGLTPDGNRGVFMSWEVLTPVDGKEGPHQFDKVMLNKVDDIGRVQLNQELTIRGIHMVSDGEGGVIIGGVTEEGYRVVREDVLGNILWDYPINSNGTDFKLVTGENGEIIILWRDHDYPHFVVQKLGADSNNLWGQPGMLEGVQIEYLDIALSPEPQIISDGSGGAVISWAEPLDSGVGWPSSVRTLQIRADGTHFYDQPIRDLESAINIYTRVVTVGSGDFVVVWEDHRNGMELYAQKVDSKAQAVWQENGVVICTIPRDISPRFEAVSSDDGSVIIAWIDGDRQLYAQKLDASGKKQWGEKGILITSEICDIPSQLIGDHQDSFIISWFTGKNVHKPEKAYIQKIDARGTLMWDDNVIRLDS